MRHVYPTKDSDIATARFYLCGHDFVKGNEDPGLQQHAEAQVGGKHYTEGDDDSKLHAAG